MLDIGSLEVSSDQSILVGGLQQNFTAQPFNLIWISSLFSFNLSNNPFEKE